MDNLTKLLQSSTKEQILNILDEKLKQSDEAPFWKEKILPYTNAVLSVLLPLKNQKLLFNPEGKIKTELDSELFFRWADVVCLRTLAFIIEQSNQVGKLVRSEYKDVSYEAIDLEDLGTYLALNRIDLIDENNLDFPMATYNLHTEMARIIKNLLG